MTTRKLIELYGRRFTPFAKIVGLIAIILFGILIAFNGRSSEEGKTNSSSVDLVLY